MLILSLLLLAALAIAADSYSFGPRRMAMSKSRIIRSFLANEEDATSVTEVSSSPADLDQTKFTPTTQEEVEKPFLILGLDPKNYNDWITVFLYGIIGYQTFQIISEIYVAATAPKS